MRKDWVRAKAAKVAKEVRLLSPRTVLPLRDTLLVFPRSHTAETVARTPAVITVVGSFNMDLFIEAPRSVASSASTTRCGNR